MPYLVAAIVLLGAVCTVNLILTLALIRRLREQAGGPPGPRQPLPKVIVGIGERPAEFTAATTEGEPIDRDAVAGGLVGFFSPQCSPCRERVPEFMEYAHHAVVDRTRVVAVLVGRPEEVADLADTLDGIARIVVEPVDGPLSTAFAVGGLPALCLLDQTSTVLAAWLTKSVLDRLTAADTPLTPLLAAAAGLAATGVVLAVVPHAVSYTATELERRVALLARERLYTAVNALPGLSKLEDPAFQDRLQLAEQGSRSGPGRLVTSLVGAGQAAVSLSGFIATLVALSPVTAAVVLASALPAFLVQLSLSRAQAAMLWRTGHGQRREVFYARLLSTPYAAKEVRLFGLGTFFRDRMLSELTAVNAEHRRLGRRQVRAHGALALLAATVAGAGLVWVISQAKAGALTVGGVAVFVAAVAGVQGALANGVQHAATAHHGLLLFEHYQTVLTIDPDVPVPARPHAVPVLRHGIALHDVWFRYSADHPWVLRGVDLFIPHGRTVALVGLNGAGKSTLVKLLCRFYDPTRGAIEWDGIDVREVDPARLRERIGAVFQDFSAYDLTAAENIGVGDLAALDDRSRIEAAARRAGAHDMVTGLPRGYDTLLTRVFFQGSDADDPQTGVLLSGGQWQRVALARALLRDGRDLMILDEPSAGLDAQAEYEVHAALRAHRAGRTALLISHRLSAVRDADLIVVLADGRVVEQGSHAELMAMQGRYAELFEVQARGYADLASTDLANADLASTAGGR